MQLSIIIGTQERNADTKWLSRRFIVIKMLYLSDKQQVSLNVIKN